jgi:hypothetical protein
MVAGEQDFAGVSRLVCEGKVIGGVAGGEDGGEAGDFVAVVELVRDSNVFPGAVLIGVNLRARGLRQLVERAVMIGMGMGEEDAGDRRFAGGGEDVGYMRVVVRAGIDDGQAVGAVDEIGVGAVIGHHARIVGDDTANAGKHREGNSAGRFRFGQEGHAAYWRVAAAR